MALFPFRSIGGTFGGAPKMPQITPNPAFEDFYAQQKAAGGTFPGIMDAWQAQQQPGVMGGMGQQPAPYADVFNAAQQALQAQRQQAAPWTPWWGGAQMGQPQQMRGPWIGPQLPMLLSRFAQGGWPGMGRQMPMQGDPNRMVPNGWGGLIPAWEAEQNRRNGLVS